MAGNLRIFIVRKMINVLCNCFLFEEKLVFENRIVGEMVDFNLEKSSDVSTHSLSISFCLFKTCLLRTLLFCCCLLNTSTSCDTALLACDM